MSPAVSEHSACSNAISRLDRAAIAYLMLPLIVFIITWFAWWVAVPLMLCALVSLRAIAGPLPAADDLPVTTLHIGVAVAAASCWTLLAGADHVLFANADWHVRDAVLHDLVLSEWPVGYGEHGGSTTLLRAPVAFYLIPALVGKVTGLASAHVAMGVWTAIGTSIFLLQVLSLTGSKVQAALLAVVVVMAFSGLDIIGSLLNDGPRFRTDWNVTTHLEWWAGKFQYSSMSTQLFWVPNHALGGWLCVGLLSRHDARRADALYFMLPLLMVAAALWSPLTTMGLIPFVLLRVLMTTRATRSWSLFHPYVWMPAAVVGIAVSVYLIQDPGGISKGVAVGGSGENPIMDLLQQAQFFLLEAGFVGASILAIRRSAEVALALVILALLPLVYLGPGNDLVMRASIPSIAVLAIGACMALQQPGNASLRKRAVLVGLLAVGAVTPFAEVMRSVLLPAWPINSSATLIGVNCGNFAPHYIARIGRDFASQILRAPHPIALGPQGPAACENPALSLMWSWTFFPQPALHALSPDGAMAKKINKIGIEE